MDILSLLNHHSRRSRKHNGVVAGVFLFVVVRVLLTTYKWELKSALHLPFEAVWLEYMIFGVLMLLVLIFKPEGLLREKPTMTKPIREVVKRTRKRASRHKAEKKEEDNAENEINSKDEIIIYKDFGFF